MKYEITGVTPKADGSMSVNFLIFVGSDKERQNLLQTQVWVEAEATDAEIKEAIGERVTEFQQEHEAKQAAEVAHSDLIGTQGEV